MHASHKLQRKAYGSLATQRGTHTFCPRHCVSSLPGQKMACSRLAGNPLTQSRFSFLRKKMHGAQRVVREPTPCKSLRSISHSSARIWHCLWQKKKKKSLAFHTEEPCLQAAPWPGLTTVGFLPSGFFWADSPDCLSSQGASQCPASVGKVMSVSKGLSTGLSVPWADLLQYLLQNTLPELYLAWYLHSSMATTPADPAPPHWPLPVSTVTSIKMGCDPKSQQLLDEMCLGMEFVKPSVYLNVLSEGHHS